MSVQEFQRHDELSTQIEALAHAEANAGAAKATLANSTRALAGTRSTHTNLCSKRTHLEKRINRNENPRFLHYFVLNRKKKVEKLKGEHVVLSGTIADSSSKITTLEAEVSKHTTAATAALNVVTQKEGLEKERCDIFDKVVAENATNRLTTIRGNQAKQQAEKQSEMGLKQQVDMTIGSLNRGQQQYSQAEQLLQQARNYNHVAQFENRMEWSESERSEARRRHQEMIERETQLNRDRLINEAQQPANNAYMCVTQALSGFPAEVRARYPSLCAQIGQAHFPQLQRADMGTTMMMDMLGTMGEAINNMQSSNKIQQNMQVLEQAKMLLQQQIGLVNAVNGAIMGNIANMDSSLQTMAQEEKEESVKIFLAKRGAVLGAVQQSLPHGDGLVAPPLMEHEMAPPALNAY